MAVDILRDRSRVARQQLAVGTTGHAMMGGLDSFLGGTFLLPRSGRAAQLQQPSDLGYLETGLSMKQEVAEDAGGIVVVATACPEVVGAFQHAQLVGSQSLLRNTCF